MDKKTEKSIEQFYKNNNINPNQYAASEAEAYETGKEFNLQIAEEYLNAKVDKWLERFEDEDRQYFLQLLENYIYISEKEYRHRVYILSSYIINQTKKLGIASEEILFISVASCQGTASGGDSLRNALIIGNMEWGIVKQQIISDVSKLPYDILEKSKALVFIDDIIGTGFSIRQTIDNFFAHFPNTNKQQYIWGIAGIMVQKSAVRYLEKNIKKYNVEFHVFVEENNFIKNCFKGNYIFDEKEVKEVEKIIEDYEREIGIDKDSGKSYVMGFRACKLLLSFYYNTPNNTLCSFWKFTDKNVPVFPRDKYIRPTVKYLQENKLHYQKNAYLKGCEDKK